MSSRISFLKRVQPPASESRGLPQVTARITSRRYGVLGVKVDAIQIPDVIRRIEEWIASHAASRFIAVTGMHGIVEAQHDATFKNILSDADLVVPDGMPLVWFGRIRGYPLKRRVYGPELAESFCRETRSKYRHFFYGGAPGVAEGLAEVLRGEYGISVAGSYSPPFGPVTDEEDAQIVKLIHKAAPDVIWVGLSTPRQERWMYEHRDSVRVPALIGIGAAFDFLTGRGKQAPSWMREHGLEWSFRLWQEPRRLWRRYLIYGSEFVWGAFLELAGLKTFGRD